MDPSQLDMLRRLDGQAREQTEALQTLNQQLAIRVNEGKRSAIVSGELQTLVQQEPTLRTYSALGKAFVLEKPQTIIKSLQSKEKDARDDVPKLASKIKVADKALATTTASLNAFYANTRITASG